MGQPRTQNVSELIRQARQGDAQCRERLFGLCRSYLGFVARSQVESCLRAKVDASDLVQETMLEAYRDFERFEGRTEQEWLAWLKRILAHNAADFVRRYRGTAKRRRARGGLPPSGRQHDGRRGPRAGRALRHAEPGVFADRRRVADDGGLGRIAARLPGSDRVAQLAALAVQRGGRPHGAFAARGADALDARHPQAARGDGAGRNAMNELPDDAGAAELLDR